MSLFRKKPKIILCCRCTGRVLSSYQYLNSTGLFLLRFKLNKYLIILSDCQDDLTHGKAQLKLIEKIRSDTVVRFSYMLAITSIDNRKKMFRWQSLFI